MSWVPVSWDVGFDVQWEILQLAMRDACGYGKHRTTMRRTPKLRIQQNWHEVGFMEELHTRHGPEGQPILRERVISMKKLYDNLQHHDPYPEKGRLGVHAQLG